MSFLPHALNGRLHALNVFDGSRRGEFSDRYYRCLNVGLNLPISTGTDWFLYDFARVYARVPGELSVASWLEALKAGRSVATNGPLLKLTVAGKPIGATHPLDKPTKLPIEVQAVGRHDFQKLQLVHNGNVIATANARKKGNGSPPS